MLFRRLTVVACAAAVAFALSGCGGGGSSTASMSGPVTEGNGGDTGGSTDSSTGGSSNTGTAGTGASYMVGDRPVRTASNSISIGQQTVDLTSPPAANAPLGNLPQRTYRVFDTEGATSGPALEVHAYGASESYSHVQFGSWAEGVVSPNPGFTVTGNYGAFAHSQAGSALTPVSNMPKAGSASYEGQYAGYLERGGTILSDRGVAHITAIFSGVEQPWLAVELTSLTVDANIVPLFNVLYPSRRVMMTGPIDGNTFNTDVEATKFILDRTYPRGDAITIFAGTGLAAANTGGMRGGFFGNNADEIAGVYQYTAGRTRGVGAFGGTLQ